MKKNIFITKLTMNEDTSVSSKKLKNNNVVFIIGDSPTVTFNENVTVYTYPKIDYTHYTHDTYDTKDTTDTTDTKDTKNTKQETNFIRRFIRLFINKFKV